VLALTGTGWSRRRTALGTGSGSSRSGAVFQGGALVWLHRVSGGCCGGDVRSRPTPLHARHRRSGRSCSGGSSSGTHLAWLRCSEIPATACRSCCRCALSAWV